MLAANPQTFVGPQTYDQYGQLVLTPTVLGDDATQQQMDAFMERLESPGTQRTLRTAGVFIAPFTGFLWGMVIGGIFGPKGEKWDMAIEAGIYSAAVNTSLAVLSVPQFMEPVTPLFALPLPTVAAGYATYKRRKGEVPWPRGD